MERVGRRGVWMGDASYRASALPLYFVSLGRHNMTVQGIRPFTVPEEEMRVRVEWNSSESRVRSGEFQGC